MRPLAIILNAQRNASPHPRQLANSFDWFGADKILDDATEKSDAPICGRKHEAAIRSRVDDFLLTFDHRLILRKGFFRRGDGLVTILQRRNTATAVTARRKEVTSAPVSDWRYGMIGYEGG